MPSPYFDHEKLNVYQASIRFISWVDPIVQELASKLAVRDQMDRASTSVPLNIAEGNGKFTAPDRCRFFDNARGSALECAACLDVLVAKKAIAPEAVVQGKEILRDIVSMLIGLIRANDPNRVAEDEGEYLVIKN
jgi:four helix bundle protein